MTNGVKQGAVLSPILFTIYIDGLLEELRASGIGCHVGQTFAGAFGYAGDIVLLSPSIDAMKHCIKICEAYSTKYQIRFNPSKSKLMCFNADHIDVPLLLCGQPISEVDHEVYLGNHINLDISDRSITRAVNSFNGKSMHIIADFNMIDCFSLCRLHSTYCMNLYGCELWNYNSNYVNEMFVAWRKVTRKLFKLPPRAHNYIVCSLVECISVKLDRRIVKYMFSVINTNNQTMRDMIHCFMSCDSSVFAENCRYIMYKYEIPIIMWYGELKALMSKVTAKHVLTDEQLSNVSAVQELCSIRDNILTCHLLKCEVQSLIDIICLD